MSLDEYRRRVLKAVDEQKDEMLTQLANVRHRQLTTDGNGGVTPASTCEEIALRHVELSSRILALDVARNIVIKQWQEMTAPKQEPADENKKPDQTESVY